MMLLRRSINLLRQRDSGTRRQRDTPVFTPLTVSHNDVTVAEVHILDAQSQGLENAQTRAIQQRNYQVMGAA